VNALQELNVEEALQAAFEAGFSQGCDSGRDMERYNQRTYGEALAKKPGLREEQVQAQIKLTNAVGQTLDTQARLLQGLASTLDNWRSV